MADTGPDDTIIELVRVESQFEADTLVASLTARGIKAYSRRRDEPRLHVIRPLGATYAVMVFEHDAAEARDLLLADDPAE